MSRQRFIYNIDSILKQIIDRMDSEHATQQNLTRLKKLYSISSKLQTKPVQPDSLLRQYVSIYVQSHHLSEQYFTTLCENRFLALMLQNSNRLVQSTSVLQCLNLLLVNTKNSSELVYILSQNAIHEYLFGPNILQQGNQFIQYYIQLLKTILLKISQHQQNKSLIRLFCNNKYPNFPLFSYATILAMDINELTKVTAQQCILILVGMINERKIYQIYLSQPPMIVFIVRLVTQFLKPDTDQQGICKYLADLLYQLKNNRIPLLLISNTICNVIIVCSLPNKFQIALNFIQLLTKAIEIRIVQHKNSRSSKYLKKSSIKQTYYQNKNMKNNRFFETADQEACDTLIIICSTFYRVLIKYLTNKYINSVYLAAYIHLFINVDDQLEKSLPLRIKYPSPQIQYKNLIDYGIKKYIQESHPSSEIELGIDFLDEICIKINQFGFSKQFIKLKQSYLKKGSIVKNTQQQGFFGRIFNRGGNDQLVNTYIKQVFDFAGLHVSRGQAIKLNIAKQVNPILCPFYSEFSSLSSALKNGLKYDRIKTGQQSDSVQSDEVNFNDIRSMWSFTQGSLEIIASMSTKFEQFLNSSNNQSQIIVVPKIYTPPNYLFLVQLRDYLATSIQDHMNKQEKNKQLLSSVQMMILLTKITSLLNVQLSQNSYTALMNQLNNIHQQLQTCLFQYGFGEVVQFIKKKNKFYNKFSQEKPSNINYIYLQITKQNSKQQNANNVKMKENSGLTIIKLTTFQCIQKIMDPHIKPIHKHFESKWKESLVKQPNSFSEYYEQILSVFKITYFGKSGCLLIFLKSLVPSTIFLRVQLSNKKLLQIDLVDLQGIKHNQIDNRVLQFCGGNIENIRTQTTELAKQIVQMFRSCKFMLEQCMTNSLLEYLTNATQSLNMKGKKIARNSTQRYSVNFQTPQ